MRTAYLLIFLFAILAACSNDDTHSHDRQQPVKQFTCPMHPQVIRDEPGQCPVCGMDLVEKTSAEQPDDLMLQSNQLLLANVKLQQVMKKNLEQSGVVNARLVANEESVDLISSRAPGRIEKLFVKETGREVRAGEALYVLYSEMILTLQQEYLLAREQYEALGGKDKKYRSFVEAAERKLLLYGLTRSQISKLKNRDSLQPRVTFVAPANGIITEVNVSEGQYVNEGTALYKVQDIRSLWVEAELYPSESAMVNVGDKVNISIAGIPGSIESRVSFLSPEFRNNSRIVIARAVIENPGSRFKPGQQAQLDLVRPSQETLAVPRDAVIRDEHGSHVYLVTGENTFRPTPVKTGTESSGMVQIVAGLHEGDTIAASGAYLLYSEFVLRKGSNAIKDLSIASEDVRFGRKIE